MYGGRDSQYISSLLLLLFKLFSLVFCYVAVYLKANLTLNLLTTTIVAPPSNASKWQMGFNSAFNGLKMEFVSRTDRTLYPFLSLNKF